ncbi:MAG: Y-family DNA polymerase [Candidatus Saccharimonadales bacterium]
MYALIDCNNFFVSCERLFRPDLLNRPVVVLSNNDGCFISRSQEAKAIGLPMGAPLFKWKKEVKDHKVTLFSANFELYGDVSERMVTLLQQITPLIEVYSIDECFLDASKLSIKNYTLWASAIRDRITQEIGIPVSIGVGPTKTLAKVASTYAKKHGGVYAVTDNFHREQLLKQLLIQDVWGIGWRMAPKLQDRGITWAYQLVTASDAWLRQQFNITGMKMVEELRGYPRIPFGDKHDTRKTIMRSRSFGHKIRDYHQLESAVASFTATATMRLRAQDSVARQIVVFLSANRHTPSQKRVYLSTVVTLTEASADTARFITAALQGLQQIYDSQFAYQKAGVIIIDCMNHKQWQLSMLSDETRRDERSELMKSVDVLNKQFGPVLFHAAEKLTDDSWRSKHELRSPRYTTSWAELPSLQ